MHCSELRENKVYGLCTKSKCPLEREEEASFKEILSKYGVKCKSRVVKT